MIRLRFHSDDDARNVAAPAAEAAAAGGIVLLPTESFYGLGADPASEPAISRVFALKGRPEGLALPVVCADWGQVDQLVLVPDAVRARLSSVWPGALTAILSTRRDLPAGLRGTLAVRIPGLGPLRVLLERTGPLTATSANRHGGPGHTEAERALADLTGSPDVVLDGGATAGGEPSTLVDLTGGAVRVVRRGPVGWSQCGN